MRQKIPSRFETVKSDKALFFRSRFIEMQIQAVLTFSGSLNVARLAKAARLTFEAEPVLGCRFQEHWRQPFWQRRQDLDQLQLCQLVSPLDLDEAVLDYLAVPIDLREDPLIQMTVFRGDRDILCIKANHLALDGGGLNEYLGLLASIYRQLAVQADFRPEVNLQGSRSSNQIIAQFGLWDRFKMMRRGFRDWKDSMFPARNWMFPMRAGRSAARKFLIRRIEPEQFRMIKEYGKKRGATVNDMMTTTFYRALHRMLQPAADVPLRLGTTVNLRRYLPRGRGEALCNLAGFTSINIGTCLGRTFDDTLELVHQAFQRLKEDCLGLGVTCSALFNCRLIPFVAAARLCRLIAACNRWLGPEQIAPWLSNGGVLRKEEIDFGESEVIDAFIVPPISSPPLLIISITGFEQSITLSIGLCEPNFEGAQIYALLDSVVAELASLAESSDPLVMHPLS